MPSDTIDFSSAIMLPVEAARYTRVAKSTLAKLRCWGGGPPYLKLGRKIGYHRADLDNWLASRRARSTSDADRLPRRLTDVVGAECPFENPLKGSFHLRGIE